MKTVKWEMVTHVEPLTPVPHGLTQEQMDAGVERLSGCLEDYLRKQWTMLLTPWPKSLS